MPDSDETCSSNAAGSGPTPTLLPEHEPGPLPVLHGRNDVLRQIDAHEGALRYMGALHPRRDETRQRLQGLRRLLRHFDATLAVRARRP